MDHGSPVQELDPAPSVAPCQADCSACAALCCVALAFSWSDQFGHDKLAGQPCHHLDAGFRCSIHARREDLGYDGCEAFDCLGAGQRATAMHRQAAQRRDPARVNQLHADFAALMRLQEMRQALLAAAELDLDTVMHVERQVLLDTIAARADSNRPNVGPDAEPLVSAGRAFLAKLRKLGVGPA